jgi:membrane protease YdiL (CAAX protease family)
VAAPRSDLDLIDLVRQLLGIVQQTCWGLLGLYLLWRAGVSLSGRLGLNGKSPGKDLAAGLGLAAVIGIPGLGLYLIAHALGQSLTVQGSTLPDTWWRWPVSILIAVENGFLEEALVIGYLLTRLGHLRVPMWWAIAIAAVLRGSYHLYQGFGGFVGNAIMGVVFGWVFFRWRRLWPLVTAHSLIDIVVFVGYPLLHGHVSWLP